MFTPEAFSILDPKAKKTMKWLRNTETGNIWPETAQLLKDKHFSAYAPDLREPRMDVTDMSAIPMEKAIPIMAEAPSPEMVAESSEKEVVQVEEPKDTTGKAEEEVVENEEAGRTCPHCSRVLKAKSGLAAHVTACKENPDKK